jgi:hypothetical protein
MTVTDSGGWQWAPVVPAGPVRKGVGVLGLNSRRLLSPEHGDGWLNMKVWNAREKQQ